MLPPKRRNFFLILAVKECNIWQNLLNCYAYHSENINLIYFMLLAQYYMSIDSCNDWIISDL